MADDLSYDTIPDPERALEARKNFALVIENSCLDFEFLQHIIRGILRVSADDLRISLRAPSQIQMALAKSFLFGSIRARRMIQHSRGILNIDATERKRFIRELEPAVNVRDVNEHGYDTQAYRGKSGKETVRPKMHEHEAGSFILDETSMFVEGPNHISMGPLNLFDIYQAVVRMRSLAGFESLPQSVLMPSYPAAKSDL